MPTQGREWGYLSSSDLFCLKYSTDAYLANCVYNSGRNASFGKTTVCLGSLIYAKFILKCV